MAFEAVAKILGESKWVGAQIAKAKVALQSNEDQAKIARTLYENSALTLKRSKEIVELLGEADYESFLEPRNKMGSAENPITKLFPAAVTERQFLDQLEKLCDIHKDLDYIDERFTGHTLVDFTLTQGDLRLPVNVKNAGTRFENAESLVGLAPDDCIPIPAYKAYGAIEKEPNLLYAICIDYTLIAKIERALLTRFSKDEAVVWQLLSQYKGAHIKDAEDRFVYTMVNRHWEAFSQQVAIPVFRVLSARKAIRILKQLPKRTPGIGLRAWGTGASAEVNVHISVTHETKQWEEIHRRVAANGLSDIIQAVNRKTTEVVDDPEI